MSSRNVKCIGKIIYHTKYKGVQNTKSFLEIKMYLQLV